LTKDGGTTVLSRAVVDELLPLIRRQANKLAYMNRFFYETVDRRAIGPTAVHSSLSTDCATAT
jgi:hypothetical protein